MGIIFASSRRKKARIKIIGKSLDILSLWMASTKAIVEKVSEEKTISIEEAEMFLLDCFKEGVPLLKKAE